MGSQGTGRAEHLRNRPCLVAACDRGVRLDRRPGDRRRSHPAASRPSSAATSRWSEVSDGGLAGVRDSRGHRAGQCQQHRAAVVDAVGQPRRADARCQTWVGGCVRTRRWRACPPPGTAARRSGARPTGRVGGTRLHQPVDGYSRRPVRGGHRQRLTTPGEAAQCGPGNRRRVIEPGPPGASTRGCAWRSKSRQLGPNDPGNPRGHVRPFIP